MKLEQILTLEPHGPDTYVGSGPRYPWGGLYGGQIVAQALTAAAETVEDGLEVHSLRAYFIRRGDQDEPVRYEVDRIRNGRSFATRRVVARQAIGAILNLEASFQRPETSEVVDLLEKPVDLPKPDTIESTSWSPVFERRFLDEPEGSAASGTARAWLKTKDSLPEDHTSQAAALAFLSDDLPTDSIVRSHPVGKEPQDVIEKVLFTASLDHTMWFHRPFRADQWHLHHFESKTFTSGRGLATGRIFAENGSHVATIAQECLLRDNRQPR